MNGSEAKFASITVYRIFRPDETLYLLRVTETPSGEYRRTNRSSQKRWRFLRGQRLRYEELRSTRTQKPNCHDTILTV
jgi:hypothetical protein